MYALGSGELIMSISEEVSIFLKRSGLENRGLLPYICYVDRRESLQEAEQEF